MKKMLKIVLGLALLPAFICGCSSDGESGGGDGGKKTDGTFIYDENRIYAANTSISGNIVIPSEYEGVKITEIPKDAFASCSSITSITIPNTIKKIGRGAFNGCSRLKEITIPFVGASEDGTANEGLFGYIFGSTSYSGATACEQYTRDYWTEHVKYYIPTTLTKVTVTNALSLSYGAFQGMTTLKTINLNSDLITISKHTFKNCQKLETISLPSVSEIPYACFNECWNLKSVSFNEEVTSIGDYAFENCQTLSKINSEEEGTYNLPGNLQTIGWSFGGCVSVKKMIVPFAGCVRSGSGSLNMGAIFGKTQYSGCTAVDQYSKADVHNKYYVPNSLEEIEVYKPLSIGYGCFMNMTMLKTLRIKESVKDSVGARAFENCVEPTWF